MTDEYIRKADAVAALDELRVNSLDAEKGLLLLSGIAAASDIIESLEPADVVSKADIAALLEETEKELVKDTDKYSIAYNFIVSVIGIIKCKIMQMGEKDDQ